MIDCNVLTATFNRDLNGYNVVKPTPASAHFKNMSGCFSLYLCRFLHNLAVACCTGGNPGVCVWSHVNEYQHNSVSPHALSYSLFSA